MNDINLLGTKAEVDKVVDTFTKEIHFLLDMTIIKEMFENIQFMVRLLDLLLMVQKTLLKVDLIKSTRLNLLCYHLICLTKAIRYSFIEMVNAWNLDHIWIIQVQKKFVLPIT